MAVNKNDTAGDVKEPTAVMMPRAVHELVTGIADPKAPIAEARTIAAGTVITDVVAKAHELDADALARLMKTGAVDEVEVLVA